MTFGLDESATDIDVARLDTALGGRGLTEQCCAQQYSGNDNDGDGNDDEQQEKAML